MHASHTVCVFGCSALSKICMVLFDVMQVSGDA